MKWMWRAGGREIELDWSLWTGKRRLHIDGAERPVPGGMLTMRSEVAIELPDGQARLELRQRFLALTQASLAVNGRPVEPELAPEDAPWWTWVFVIGIAGILVASRGGALWGALIGAGAVSCAGVVRMRRPAAVRALLCAAITAGCWGAFYAIRALST